MFKHATLNRAYRLVWSELRNTWIAVAEFARTRGKRASGAVAIGTVLALGAASAMAAGEPSPTALPTNGQVVAGQVGISSSGARMDVTQGSNSAIVNWDSFNIGSQAHVNFAQPDATAVILNRVIGGNGSTIMGRMTANGNVFLVDPSGILFAPGAQVDVGGLVASTLGISDANFLAGIYKFANTDIAGAVVNKGNITANGGFVALIAPQVSNSGTITATNGSVGLAAGDSVNLDFDHDGMLSFQVNVAAAAARADNSGVIVADGGRVVMNAQAKDALLSTVLNNDGVIRARSLESRNGEIWLGGGSSGVVSVTGTLDASGTEAGQAGGTVKVLGDKVGLFAQAKIDVSGVGAGGTALVGGNWQGKGPEQNASATYVGKDASIKADAVGAGDGGKVVVWSDQGTRFDGSISATGGAQGGDGGLVEVSGRDGLAFNGTVGAAAPMGKTGTLLLDPNDIYLIHGADTTGSEDANVTASAIDFAYVNIGNGEISDGKLDSLGDVNIILQAKNLIQVGTFAGASQAVSLTALTSNTLTLQSGDNTALGNINFVNGSSLTTAGGNVAMYAGVNPVGNVPYATDTGTANLGAITTNGGSLSVYAKGTLTAGGAIASNGGAVSLNAQDALAVDGGITAGAGAVNLLANQDGAGAQGFSQADATTIAGTGITVTVNTGAGTGTGGAVLSTLTDAGALAISTSNAATDAGGSITRTATGTLSGTSVALTTGTGDIGAAGTEINLAANQTGVVATTHGAGAIYLRDAGALTLGAITTAGGLVDIATTAAGTLTAGGAIASNGGAVSLNAQDALAVDGGITAGAGAVNLLANQDGAGAQGFSQADATTIAGTGITVTVNTGAGTGTGGAVLSTLTDAGALAISTSNAATDAGGSITRTATGTLSGTSVALTTGTGDIGAAGTEINLAANQTGVVATTHGAGAIYLRDAGALTLGAITTAGGLVDIATTAAGTLTAGGAIASNGGAVSLNAQDALAVDGGITAGAGAVNLLANQDGAGAQGFSQADATTIAGTGITVTVNTGAGTGTGGAVLSTLTDAGALAINTSNAATDAGGSITSSGVLTIAGTTSFNAGTANDITLGNANDFGGAVSVVSGNNVTLNDTGTIDLGASTVSGNLVLTAAGAITDSGNLFIAGTTTLTPGAGNSISLDQAGNNFGGALSVTNGANVTVVDSSALDLGVIGITGDLTATATTGDISNTGALTIGGNSSFTANAVGASIGVANAGNNFTGTVAFGGVGGLANVAVVDVTALDLQATTLSGNLNVTAAGMTNSGALSVTGVTSLTAGAANDITLGSANNFGGAVTVVSGNNVTLNDTGAIDLAASTVSGSLVVTAAGAITDSGNLAITGTTSLTAGAANNIVLDNANNFGGAVTVVSGSNVTLNDIGAIDFAATTVSGNLVVTAAGAITDSGNLAITGTTSLSAGAANDITLDSGNDFGGTVTVLSGKDVRLNDTGSIDLASSTVSGYLDVTAGSGITESGVLTVGGNLWAFTNIGDILLKNLNALSGSVSLIAGAGNQVWLNATRIEVGTIRPSDLTTTNVGITAANVTLEAPNGSAFITNGTEGLVTATAPLGPTAALTIRTLPANGVIGDANAPTIKGLRVQTSGLVQVFGDGIGDGTIFLIGDDAVQPKYEFSGDPLHRIVKYNGVDATNAQLTGALDAAYLDIRNQTTEIRESGFAKENASKVLRRGVVTSAGPGQPAVDDSTGLAGMELCDGTYGNDALACQ